MSPTRVTLADLLTFWAHGHPGQYEFTLPAKVFHSEIGAAAFAVLERVGDSKKHHVFSPVYE